MSSDKTSNKILKRILINILGKSITGSIEAFFVSISIRKTLKSFESLIIEYSAKNIVDFLFSKDAHNIKPWQNYSELLSLAELIASKKPKILLEIGTAKGGTLFMASKLADNDALLISIDLPFGMYGGGYPEWKIPLYKSFKKGNQKIELIRGDSHSIEIYTHVKSILKDHKVDFLFIDGDHTYEGVKRDFELYSTLTSTQSIIAFHDIVSDKSDNPDHFVSVFWNEIKKSYPSSEYISDKHQSKLGIGVLFINH